MSELVTYKANISDMDALQTAIDALNESGALECQYLGYGSAAQYTRSLGHQFAVKGQKFAFCVNKEGAIQIESMSGLKPQVDIIIQQYYIQLLRKRAEELGYFFSSTERADGTADAQIFADDKLINITIPRAGIAKGESKIMAEVDGIKGPACSGVLDTIFQHDKAEKREETDAYYETAVGVTAENDD